MSKELKWLIEKSKTTIFAEGELKELNKVKLPYYMLKSLKQSATNKRSWNDKKCGNDRYEQVEIKTEKSVAYITIDIKTGLSDFHYELLY